MAPVDAWMTSEPLRFHGLASQEPITRCRSQTVEEAAHGTRVRKVVVHCAQAPL